MRNRAHFSSKFTNIRTTKKENQLSIKSISHSVHDPVCLNFLHFILPHSSQRSKKKKKKETNYVPSNRHTHPKSPFILLLIPFSDLPVHRLVSSITTATVSTTVETPWTQPPPCTEEILLYHSFSPFPQNINGHRPFEFNRFNPRKKKLAAAPPVSRTRNGSFPCGKRVRGGPRAASWCALRTPKPPPLFLSLFWMHAPTASIFQSKKGTEVG